MSLLEVKGLQAEVDTKPILRGLDLSVEEGEIVALLGPNGSGKSTLAHVLMGHPDYVVTGGQVFFRGQDVLVLSPEERAKAGLFLSFQYPQSIAGVTMGNFLRLAYMAVTGKQISVSDFLKILQDKMQLLGIPMEFIQRAVNEGFSGGEKKRAEILQLALLMPKLAILDETDSGLDIDALKAVAQAVKKIRELSPSLSLLVITHYQRLLDYLPPDRVVVMRAGEVVANGGLNLITSIEEKGYDNI